MKDDDDFGDAWERACYRAGTQGMINVLMMGGGLLAIMILIALVGKWLGA